MGCSPTKITELSESVLVEDILVESQKRVALARNYKRKGMEVRAAVKVLINKKVIRQTYICFL